VSAAPAEKLTALEVKLLSLILDQSAAEGEISAGAQKLVESWRRRGVTAEQLSQILAPEPLLAKQFEPDYGLCRFPWGRNKGKLFIDVAPSELRNAANWARSNPEVARKFSGFISDVEKFLAQSR
jgi:hypothetical protein